MIFLIDLNIIKINGDKNGRFTFSIFEKPETDVSSCFNGNRIVTSKKEEKPKDTKTRKIYINSNNNNPVIKLDNKEKIKVIKHLIIYHSSMNWRDLTEYSFYNLNFFFQQVRIFSHVMKNSFLEYHSLVK